MVFDRSNTPAFRANWVKDILGDRSRRFWVATYGGGLFCRESGRFVRYGADRGLPQDIVLSPLEDRDRTIWTGLRAAGLSRDGHMP